MNKKNINGIYFKGLYWLLFIWDGMLPDDLEVRQGMIKWVLIKFIPIIDGRLSANTIAEQSWYYLHMKFTHRHSSLYEDTIQQSISD